MLKRFIRNEKGLTLIELLAVIVILGIIAAIAIPSIGGLIDNSKKDAHVANAQQMINAAKIAVTADKDLIPANEKYTVLPLAYLESKGYLETVKDPDGNTTSYKKAPSGYDNKPLTSEGDPKEAYSYVLIKNTDTKLIYFVKLINNSRGVFGEDGVAVEEKDLKRDAVNEIE
ncbi:type II secretory pathway pseudopilin PulG [Anoxybacillus gonensis]|uniref:Prepilin-type N-terminal cleavage/methylation domain-containing protein n=1 Tax=Anoxybacillus gonensis TaxID=198467 RepID=A0AAW7TJA0_9BACL|nr:prepilin-type N-terminal cleavage/methylation domain-containing protein [Anoxybacillus gonensis]AKS39093.1 type II secretory pathway pseudopilin PulG [Anoxybacillus gonensis]KGP61228.1 type II secretory pathway pseudopilin PulG [Anoxybacillus gonensis]MCX8047475.1 prepilin-type N-terminal cleavage/methylation domain-containing protein [Anoxybacillus gonensis]MDO0876860.1 prepilin-type N-terminal cleavage/methylation domain-containing protein [Anoxybacillus gonensis]